MDPVTGSAVMVNAFQQGGTVMVPWTATTIPMKLTVLCRQMMCRPGIVQKTSSTARTATNAFTRPGSVMQMQTVEMELMKLKNSVSTFD